MDSYQTDETTRKDLLKVEHKQFEHILKDVEKETGPWSGSNIQNYLADVKIANSIYSSFKTYEGGMRREGTFFIFKRL